MKVSEKEYWRLHREHARFKAILNGIANRDVIELMLDPLWASRIAADAIKPLQTATDTARAGKE